MSAGPSRDDSLKDVLAFALEPASHPESARASAARERRFEEIANSAPAILWMTEPDGLCSFLNRRWYESTGQEPGTGLGLGWIDALHPDDRAATETAFLDANHRRTSFEVDYRVRGADGSYRWAYDAGEPRFGPDGTYLGMVGVVVDIEDRKRAEQSLAQSRQRLDYAAQAAGVGFWYCDLPFSELVWDDRVKQHFHVPPDTPVTIETFFAAIHPDDREPTRIAIDRSIQERIPYGVDFRTVNTETGETKWIRAAGGAGYAEDGTPITFDGLTLDITDRKRIEDDLRRVKERLSLSLEASELVGTWDWDLKTGLVTADERFARLYSIPDSRVSNGVPIEEFTRSIHPDDAPQVSVAIDQTLALGVDFAQEYRLIQSDGSIRWVVARGRSQRDEHGNAVRFPGVAIDITDRMETQEKLKESEARFRHLADAMPQMVFTARPDGHVDYFNRKWYEYTGFVDDGTTGDASWAEVHEPDGLERVKTMWAEALRTGEPYEIEYRLRRADGSFRWHLGRALPIRGADGKIVRWYGTNTDIDDRKRAEAAIEAARDEAQAANRMKDEFLATLSHELRTPLNAILGWAKILRSGHMDEEDLEEGLAAIERNSVAQAQIIEDLLDISRIVSGNFKLEVQRVNLREIIEAAMAAVMPAANAREIRVQKMLDTLAGPVSGDPARLQQVVWNLISNAVKFTPRGGKVQVLLERVNSHLEISVIDSGMGIRPEFLPHVFDRFRQADSSTTRRYGGLGLGLAIVKQLVEMHGGTVRAKSPGEGQGSTFTVTLPITVVHPDQSVADRLRPSPTGDPDELFHGNLLDGVRVLVVDDEADARHLIRRVLQECRAEVVLAASAAEALALIDGFQPDVIVSDIGMPDQDGYEFMRQVRTKQSSRRLPAAALTAFARADDRRQALLAGFQTHVSKPVDPAELVAVVASLAGKTGTA